MFRKQLFFAWRNILRNKRRAFLTCLVIGTGLWCLILQDAFFLGMMENLTLRATETFMGEGQIHAKGFRSTGEVEKTVVGLDEVKRSLENSQDIASYSLRVKAPCMLNAPKNIIPITLYGIDIEKEKELSRISSAVFKGEVLTTSNKSGILLGYKMADFLEVDIGDRIVATVAQAHTGEITQELLRVCGIFAFEDSKLDKKIAFVHLEKSQKMLNLSNAVHEIVFKFYDREVASSPDFKVWGEIKSEGNETCFWKDLFPSIRALIGMADIATYITGGILFLLVVFIIMNSLFMSLFERMQEFGILKALGTKSSSLFALIILESGVLAVLSLFFGIVLTIISAIVLSVTGIDYSGIRVGDLTISEPIYPLFIWQHFVTFPFFVFIFTLFSASIPAISVTRASPIQALTKYD